MACLTDHSETYGQSPDTEKAGESDEYLSEYEFVLISCLSLDHIDRTI